MRLAVAVPLFATLVTALDLAGAEIDLADGKSIIRLTIAPESSITKLRVSEMSTEFLNGIGVGRKLAVLSVYSQDEIAARQVSFCENDYSTWQVYHNKLSAMTGASAHMVSFGQNAVLMLRTVDGKLVRETLRGRDPTRMMVDGKAYEILFVAGRRRSPLEERGQARTVEPILYITTNVVLTRSLCERAASQILQATGVDRAWVSFRNDPWFICQNFPVFYPYGLSEPVPMENEFVTRPEFTCIAAITGVRCTQTAGSGPLKH